MAKVKLLTKVNHSGERFNEGDVLDNLTDAQAEQLIESGAAERTRDSKASSGTPIAAKASRVKQDLGGQDLSQRKTVSQKAQERAAKADTSTPKGGGGGGTEAAREPDLGGTPEEPAAGDSANDGTPNTGNEPGGEGTPSTPSNPTTDDGDQTVGNDPKAVSFELDGVNYTRKADKNGVPQYRADGKSVSKVDFIAAQQRAGQA
jgi:hypothetical protein